MFTTLLKTIPSFYRKLNSWQVVLLWLIVAIVSYFVLQFIIIFGFIFIEKIPGTPFYRYRVIESIRSEVKNVPEIKDYELGWNEDITVEDIWIDIETQTGGRLGFEGIGSLATASNLTRVGNMAFIRELFYREGQYKGQYNGYGWSLSPEFILQYQHSPTVEPFLKGGYREYQGARAIKNYEELIKAIDSLPKCGEGFIQETREHWVERTCVFTIQPENDQNFAQDDDPKKSKWRIPSPTNECHTCDIRDSQRGKIDLEIRDGIVWKSKITLKDLGWPTRGQVVKKFGQNYPGIDIKTGSGP